MKFFLRNFNINFVDQMNTFVKISIAFIIVGIISFLFRGKKNFGIDFTGGVLQQVQFFEKTDAQEVRRLLKNQNISKVSIQKVADQKGSSFIVRSSIEMRDHIKKVFQSKATKKNKILREEVVGPTAGKSLRNQGLLAIFFSLLGILIYISIRFEFLFAISAIFALFHDISITIGCLSLLHIEISLQILAALLTIVGYSLNDTIIIFDRIREMSKNSRTKESFSRIVNRSINKTLSRTILTSLTTFIVVFILFLFGGNVVRDFSIALMIGIIIGTYSSIFIASYFLCYYKRNKKK